MARCTHLTSLCSLTETSVGPGSDVPSGTQNENTMPAVESVAAFSWHKVAPMS